MGYTAQTLSSTPIIIKNEKAKQLIDLLREAEKTYGHISWCRSIADYEQDKKLEYSNIVVSLMSDYGFIVDYNNDETILMTWGGDKIGSSWDDIWNALAQVAHNDAVWIMHGEDDAVWGEELKDGNRRVADVSFTVQN
jgi:hypothetical protein